MNRFGTVLIQHSFILICMNMIVHYYLALFRI